LNPATHCYKTTCIFEQFADFPAGFFPKYNLFVFNTLQKGTWQIFGFMLFFIYFFIQGSKNSYSPLQGLVL